MIDYFGLLKAIDSTFCIYICSLRNIRIQVEADGT
jgi:hypothetical protein